MDEPAPRSADRSQTADHTCALLRLIARADPPGARLKDLCERSGLSKAAVHRILRSLCDAALVRQDAASRRYSLGIGMLELGLAVEPPIRAFPAIRRLIEALAQQTNDSAYLMMRSYDDVVCVWGAEGNFPIRATVLTLGGRRPLAASAAGIAILAGLAPAQVERIILANAPYLPEYCRMGPHEVRHHVTQARASGHVYGEDLVMNDVAAFAMHIPSRHEAPSLAVSVTTLKFRANAQRKPVIVKELANTVNAIAALLA